MLSKIDKSSALFITAAVVFFWIGGFLLGLLWIDVSIPFIDTVKFMQPFWAVRLLGGTLMFLGILIFSWNILVTWTGRSDRPVETF